MEESVKAELRSKLRNGKTITEVCHEYRLTFKELTDLMMGYNNPICKGHKPKSWVYINENNGKYALVYQKEYYGRYERASDAKKVRDYFLKYGWDKEKLDFVCKLVGVERCRK